MISWEKACTGSPPTRSRLQINFEHPVAAAQGFIALFFPWRLISRVDGIITSETIKVRVCCSSFFGAIASSAAFPSSSTNCSCPRYFQEYNAYGIRGPVDHHAVKDSPVFFHVTCRQSLGWHWQMLKMVSLLLSDICSFNDREPTKIKTLNVIFTY